MLGDSALPATLLTERAGEWWHLLALKLPRQALIAHLGFEPRGGLHRPRGTPAARLLLDLVRGHDDPAGQASSPADSYMQLVIYDLVGALFAPPDPWAASRHTDKLFARVRSLIEARLADPDFGPADVAAEAGISLRYVQKLFTQHGGTCSEFIYGLRLERAARLLRRRTSLRSGQPLAEIAYACGFRDYTHFARKFRARFGCPPGAARQNGTLLRARLTRLTAAESSRTRKTG
jgi:AraC-like DNA-binding protein